MLSNLFVVAISGLYLVALSDKHGEDGLPGRRFARLAVNHQLTAVRDRIELRGDGLAGIARGRHRPADPRREVSIELDEADDPLSEVGPPVQRTHNPSPGIRFDENRSNHTQSGVRLTSDRSGSAHGPDGFEQVRRRHRSLRAIVRHDPSGLRSDREAVAVNGRHVSTSR